MGSAVSTPMAHPAAQAPGAGPDPTVPWFITAQVGSTKPLLCLGRARGNRSEARGDQRDDQSRTKKYLVCLWRIFSVQPRQVPRPGVGGQGDLGALQHHSDILRSLTYKEERFVLAGGAGVTGQIQTDLLLGACWGVGW